MHKKRLFGLLIAAFVFPQHDLVKAAPADLGTQNGVTVPSVAMQENSNTNRSTTPMEQVNLSGIHQADYLLRQGKLAEAEAVCNNLLQKDGSNPVLYLLRGRIDFAANNYSKAVADFNAAFLHRDSRIDIRQSPRFTGRCPVSRWPIR